MTRRTGMLIVDGSASDIRTLAEPLSDLESPFFAMSGSEVCREMAATVSKSNAEQRSRTNAEGKSVDMGACRRRLDPGADRRPGPGRRRNPGRDQGAGGGPLRRQ
ncbi:hypothetical protein MTBSS4_140028 [Magnetospirillum sp. SS-4]|nr:hypothetical protein MTBSS4_140028 [Magnetospirillum sp. SS-4]